MYYMKKRYGRNRFFQKSDMYYIGASSGTTMIIRLPRDFAKQAIAFQGGYGKSIHADW